LAKPRAYYNEFDPFAAAWLQNLMAEGLIMAGEIDSRSIVEVQPEDLKGFTRVHFFAGIGGWDYALQLAEWPADRPVWTGSCPCQPFSQAGKRKGTSDERHLWPEMLRLISECSPATVFGEQVASKDGRLWLSGVRTDLEALGYAVGASDLCAAGVGAPHIRQRLYWLADSECYAGESRRASVQSGSGTPEEAAGASGQSGRRGNAGRMGNADDSGLEGRGVLSERPNECAARTPGLGRWSNYIWIPCLDGKARRIKPGLEPLAHGIPHRVGRLRGYGNAIVPQVAEEFVRAFLDITD
jgi:DNA (cytosine-5)-methyltransferase 1